jgi:hypothetical protein
MLHLFHTMFRVRVFNVRLMISIRIRTGIVCSFNSLRILPLLLSGPHVVWVLILWFIPPFLQKCLYQVRVITVFTVFRLLTDFVCLYTWVLTFPFEYWYYVGVSVHLVEIFGSAVFRVWVLVQPGMLSCGSTVNNDWNCLLRMLDFSFVSSVICLSLVIGVTPEQRA